MSHNFSLKNYYTQHCVQLLVCTSHLALLITFIFIESDGIEHKPTTKISLNSQNLPIISFRVKRMFTLNSHNLVADKPMRIEIQWCYYNWLRYQNATITSNLWSFKPKYDIKFTKVKPKNKKKKSLSEKFKPL